MIQNTPGENIHRPSEERQAPVDDWLEGLSNLKNPRTIGALVMGAKIIRFPKLNKNSEAFKQLKERMRKVLRERREKLLKELDGEHEDNES